MTEEEILEHYAAFLSRLVARGLSRQQAVAVIREIGQSCRYCLNGSDRCQCWNDE